MGAQPTGAGRRDGLRIKRQDVDRLVKDVGAELKAALEQKFVERKSTDHGSFEIHHFTTVPPVAVPAGRAAIPCIPIALEAFPKIWIAVELRIGRTGETSERSRGEHFLEHVSIKLLQGEPQSAGEMLFRAEWDARDTGLVHAQPHWNIHKAVWQGEAPTGGFSTFVAKERALNFHDFDRAGSRDTTEATFQHVRMHFALASTWHKTSGAHSCALENVDDVTRWIAGCCRYIRAQFTHMGKRAA